MRVAKGVLDRAGYLGGDAEQRAAGVLEMFGDPEISLVLPATGGTGAGHLVSLLDYDLIRAHPKLFTGFSDPSVLNNAILAGAGLPNAFGVSGFQFFGFGGVDEPTETAFWQMVTGPIAGLEVPGADWRVYRADSGAVSGPVVGGRFPIITGVEFGHQERKIQFPIGCRVEFGLSGQRPVLRYLEDLVTPGT